MAGPPGDIAAIGATILADLAVQVPSDRSAVVLDDDGWAVPVALRGTGRFPWREPSRPDSALHTTWTGRVAHAGSFQDDEAEVGTCEALSVPLLGVGDELLGVLVADRKGPAYGEGDARAAAAVVSRSGPGLQLAVLVSREREDAMLQERARVARRVHDGLAQDMAALGYQADAARALVRRHDPGADTAVEELHVAIREAIGEVRSYLSELATPHRTQQSLGELLAGQVEALEAMTGVQVRWNLSDTRLRFPDWVEGALRDIATAVVRDARGATDLTTIEFSGTLDAPRAELVLTHDGTTRLRSGTFDQSPLADVGGDVRVDTSGQRDLVVTVRVPGASPEPESTVRGGDA